MNTQPFVNRISDDELVFALPPFKAENVIIPLGQARNWGIEMLGIPNLWRITKGEGVKVAILDTGIDLFHPDLKSAIVATKDFTNSQAGVMDTNGHGTHVAGIVAARDNAVGVVGVAPKAELLIGKVLGDTGFGSARMVAEGIRWAVELGADIISMSLGTKYKFSIIEEAIQAARADDSSTYVICAAGNDGPFGTVNYPGSDPETIAVGSIDRRRNISSFSPIGDLVDIMAPGDEILSTYIPQTVKVISGTSMATPFVSGVAALMIAKHRKFEGATPLKDLPSLKAHLKKTATQLGDVQSGTPIGIGLIDPEELLQKTSSQEWGSTSRS